MSLGAIRDGIKTAGEAVGLRGYDDVPANPILPCFVVSWPAEFNPNTALSEDTDDVADYVIPVWLMVPYQSSRAAGVKLETYLTKSGDGSLVAAIQNANRGWSINRVSGFGPQVVGDPGPDGKQGVTALVCTLDVSVMS